MTDSLEDQIAVVRSRVNALTRISKAAERAGTTAGDDLPVWRDALATLERLNSPVTKDFLDAVANEATHQIARWGEGHDADKVAEDWFWLVGHLAGKALRAHVIGDRGIALHHTISTAAVLFHWHRAITESGRLGVKG